jgi:hypothetical protein
MGFKGDKNPLTRLPSEAKQSRRPHVVKGMLKIPAEYDRDTYPAKLKKKILAKSLFRY